MHVIMSIIKGIFTSPKHSNEALKAVCFEALFKEFFNRLVYFSFQFTGDKEQAQDIVQEAFINYWNQHEKVADNKIAIKNFLYSSVRNASLNSLRHKKVVENYAQSSGTAEPEEPPVTDAIIIAEVMAEIHSAIHSLPENCRLVSVLGYLEGKKNREIADDLDMSVNTVKKQKQRALQLLRIKLTPEIFIMLAALAFKAFL